MNSQNTFLKSISERETREKGIFPQKNIPGFLKEYFVVKNQQSGVASLPTIIPLTVIILAIGIGITSLALTESLISAGQKQSSQALFYAEAGARDALIKIARNKKY